MKDCEYEFENGFGEFAKYMYSSMKPTRWNKDIRDGWLRVCVEENTAALYNAI